MAVVPELTEKVGTISFLFCGTGEFKGEIEIFKEMVKEDRFCKYVKYFESISGQQLRDIYLISDIFVLPSYAENLPNSMLEAMAAGLPVIVSDVGAIPEVVKDGVNGFIIKAGDIASLTEKILILTESSDLRKSMGAHNVQLIKEKYDMPVVADKIDAVYRELLKI